MAAANEPILVNTGPLVALSACGCIELLPKLHSRIVAPEAVLEEFLRGAQTKPGDARVRPDGWRCRAPSTVPSTTLVKQLDRGEAAVMTLAIEQCITLVAIDERRGRIVARALGLRVTGSVGILLRAKREGLLAAIKPSIALPQTWQLP